MCQKGDIRLIYALPRNFVINKAFDTMTWVQCLIPETRNKYIHNDINSLDSGIVIATMIVYETALQRVRTCECLCSHRYGLRHGQRPFSRDSWCGMGVL